VLGDGGYEAYLELPIRRYQVTSRATARDHSVDQTETRTHALSNRAEIQVGCITTRFTDRHHLDQAKDEPSLHAKYRHRADIVVRRSSQRNHVDFDEAEAFLTSNLKPLNNLRPLF